MKTTNKASKIGKPNKILETRERKGSPQILLLSQLPAFLERSEGTIMQHDREEKHSTADIHSTVLEKICCK